MAMMPSPSRTLRVASYNVLSSSLDDARSHIMCDPANLDSETRLERVKLKLEPEIAAGAVVALQEISLDWVGKLHEYFQSKGYIMVNGNYGNAFNGFMGVAIAWPLDKYEATRVSLDCIAKTRPWGRRPAPNTLSKVAKLPVFPWNWSQIILPLFKPTAKRGFGPPANIESLDPFDEAKRRFNQMVFVRLREKAAPRNVFCVATYHMPCMFWLPSMMVLHTALACQHVQKLAGDAPFVFAGDFNFKPEEACYKLVTQGELDVKDPAYPHPPAWERDIDWTLEVKAPLKSAYFEAQGVEPELTNWSCIGDNGEFKGCLDYLFCSRELRPTNVLRIGDSAKTGPFPTAEEPSDHVLIAATFEISS